MDEHVVQTLRPWFPGFDFARVRVVHSGLMCWFVRTVLRQGGMTLSPYVFFGRHRFDPASRDSLALLAHELRHIEQYRAMGHARFLFTYVRDRVRAGRYSSDLPLEAGPYELQQEVLAALAPPEV